MGGFADLNSFSEEPIEFTDNRPANVIFSTPVTQDQELTTTDFTITVTRPYEIEEIIRPEVTLVSYSIDVSGVAGTTVAWDTVPSGSTVTVNNGVYTIDGIDDLDEWDTVKDPTITIPADFLGSFFYEVSVNYTTAAGLQTYSWEVGVQVPVSIMQSTAALNSTVSKIENLGVINLSSAFGMTATAAITILPATFSAQFNQTTAPIFTASSAFNRSAAFSITVIPTELEALVNDKIARTYDGNARNKIFATDIITSNYNEPADFKFVISVNDGILYHTDNELLNNFGTSVQLSESNLSLLLTKLQSIEFYPDLNDTNNLTYNLSFFINDTLAGGSGTSSPLNYSGTTQAIETRLSLFSRTEFPVHPYAIQYLSRAEIYVLGGGGAGDIFNGGAGGGAVFFQDATWNLSKMQSASISNIGAGGVWSGTSGTNTDGQSTIVVYDGITRTAPGGERGRDSLGRGGNSSLTTTTTTTRTGGNETASGGNGAGGGGAGSTQNGQDATVSGTDVLWGYGGVGPIISMPFDYEDGISSILTDYAGAGGGGYSSNFSQEDRQIDRSASIQYPGTGGWAGVSNTDLKGHGSDGGIVISYYRV